MADLLQINDVVEVSLFSSVGDQTAVQILHYQIINAPAGNMTTQNFANAFDNLSTPKLKPLISQGAVYEGTGCRLVDRAPTRRMFLALGAVGPGLAAAGVLPLQTRGLVSWQTDFAGKRNRGRTYLPFPSIGAMVAPGGPSAAYITQADTWAGAIAPGVGVPLADGATSCVASMVIRNRYKPPQLPTYVFVRSHITRNGWATQRKSGNFGRPNVPPEGPS